MMRKPVSIHTLITGSMALVISMFVIIVSSLMGIFVSKAIEDNAMSSMNEIVTQVNSNLSTYISDIIDVSDYVRELSRFSTDLAADEIKIRLESLINSRDDLVSISAFDMNGRMLVSTEPLIAEDSSSIIIERWFSRAHDGEGDFFLDVNKNFHEALLRQGIDHDFTTRPGEHNDTYWNNSIDYQILFFQKHFIRMKTL